MDEDTARHRLIATLRARMQQQAGRGAVITVLSRHARSRQQEHEELVEHYVQRHAPEPQPKRRWWKFWARS